MDNVARNLEADITKYIDAKLPDMPVSTRMEIIAYICCRSMQFAYDLGYEQQKELTKVRTEQLRMKLRREQTFKP